MYQIVTLNDEEYLLESEDSDSQLIVENVEPVSEIWTFKELKPRKKLTEPPDLKDYLSLSFTTDVELDKPHNKNNYLFYSLSSSSSLNKPPETKDNAHNSQLNNTEQNCLFNSLFDDEFYLNELNSCYEDDARHLTTDLDALPVSNSISNTLPNYFDIDEDLDWIINSPNQKRSRLDTISEEDEEVTEDEDVNNFKTISHILNDNYVAFDLLIENNDTNSVDKDKLVLSSIKDEERIDKMYSSQHELNKFDIKNATNESEIYMEESKSGKIISDGDVIYEPLFQEDLTRSNVFKDSRETILIENELSDSSECICYKINSENESLHKFISYMNEQTITDTVLVEQNIQKQFIDNEIESKNTLFKDAHNINVNWYQEDTILTPNFDENNISNKTLSHLANQICVKSDVDKSEPIYNDNQMTNFNDTQFDAQKLKSEIDTQEGNAFEIQTKTNFIEKSAPIYNDEATITEGFEEDVSNLNTNIPRKYKHNIRNSLENSYQENSNDPNVFETTKLSSYINCNSKLQYNTNNSLKNNYSVNDNQTITEVSELNEKESNKNLLSIHIIEPNEIINKNHVNSLQSDFSSTSEDNYFKTNNTQAKHLKTNKINFQDYDASHLIKNTGKLLNGNCSLNADSKNSQIFITNDVNDKENTACELPCSTYNSSEVHLLMNSDPAFYRVVKSNSLITNKTYENKITSSENDCSLQDQSINENEQFFQDVFKDNKILLPKNNFKLDTTVPLIKTCNDTNQTLSDILSPCLLKESKLIEIETDKMIQKFQTQTIDTSNQTVYNNHDSLEENAKKKKVPTATLR